MGYEEIVQENYKKEVKARLASFKVGQRDVNNFEITNILTRGDEFVIYEIRTERKTDSIKVYIDNLTEKDDSGIIERYNKIRVKFNEVKQVFFKAVDLPATRSIVAQMIVHGLMISPEEANDKFKELIAKIGEEHRNQYKNRFRLIFGASIISILLMIPFIIDCYLPFMNGCVDGGKNLLFISISGSIGGLFSILLTISQLRCEEDVKNTIYILYGMVRSLIAVIAAIIIYMAIKINLIFGFVDDLNYPLIGYLLFGLLAGFSESLVPNFLDKLEKENSR